MQAISPPAFLAGQAAPAPWSTIGFGALITAASTSLTLWMVGAAYLAGQPLGKGRIAMGVAGLILTGGIALQYDPSVAPAFGATLTTLAAIVALTWLHRLGRYERIAGVAMVLLGLNQFIWVAYGNAGLPLQASVATILRVVLGLSLLHAAVSRSRGEAGQLRDQSSHLIERLHQGLAVMQGEVMKYANPALLGIYGLPADAGSRIASGTQWRNSTMSDDERVVARERHRRIVSGEIAQDH